MSDTSVPAAETPTAIDHNARERFIRDLYSVVAFFIANPGIPVPFGVTLDVAGGSIDAVRQIAAQMGTQEYGLAQGRGQAQCEFEVPGTVTPVGVIVSSR